MPKKKEIPLFETKNNAPLAEKMRPQKLSDVLGQDHLIGEGKPLTEFLSIKKIPSIIFWGPPGCGKTTIAKILAKESGSTFDYLSAVLSGVQDLREIISNAKAIQITSESKILFIDEIHRWNKAQQDALLPHIESGLITLIGSTTENPSFEVIGPLLSRTKVYIINPLSLNDLQELINRTLNDKINGLGNLKLNIDKEAIEFIAETSDGDARRALNTLEIAADLTKNTDHKSKITVHEIESALQKKTLLYDKKGEEHYNIISAFIKSMRGSDPDAAIYYLARMLTAGEDPLFIARRMVIFASEDISNADPQAIQVAIACMNSVDFVGMPEGYIPLAQCATYLASAPKSNSSYMSYLKAKEDVEKLGNLSVPMHIRNAPTKLMKTLGYSKGYIYPHNEKNNFAENVTYLPDEIKNNKYYFPSENGYERVIKERLQKLHPKK